MTTNPGWHCAGRGDDFAFFVGRGRKVCIRCTCKLNGRVLRKQTLRVTTHFCRGASAAKVGSEPNVPTAKASLNVGFTSTAYNLLKPFHV